MCEGAEHSVAHTSWGAYQHTLLHLYRSLVRSKLDYGSVVYMVLRENLTNVYWIRYRTTHCGYASVPSEPHLPQVCVFTLWHLHLYVRMFKGTRIWRAKTMPSIRVLCT